MGREGGALWVECLAVFVPSLPHPLLSTVYQTDGCLSYLGRGGSWLGCQVLPAISQSPSWSWLPIVVAPGCLRHPTSTVSVWAMKLFTVNNILLMCNCSRVKMADWFPKQAESDLTYLVDQKNSGGMIVELGYRKISWFVSVLPINNYYYLPQPSASANNIDLLTSAKSWYFAQSRSVIVNYWYGSEVKVWGDTLWFLLK